MSAGTGDKLSRRHFLGAVGTTLVGAGEVAAGADAFAGSAERSPRTAPDEPQATSITGKADTETPGVSDGPASPLFVPVPIMGATAWSALRQQGDLSETLRDRVKNAPDGDCVCWGIPFRIAGAVLAFHQPVRLTWPEVRARWFVCMHTTDIAPQEVGPQGFIAASRGSGRLNEHVADYVFLYADGTEARVAVRRRHQIGMLSRAWGENCFEAVGHLKPYPVRSTSEPPRESVAGQPIMAWGASQYRGVQPDQQRWMNWLWAWPNPHPEKAVVGLRLEPRNVALVLSAVTAGNVSSIPLRWETRQKAVLRLPDGQSFDPRLTPNGLLKHLQLDLGQVISALPHVRYPDATWADTYNNQAPRVVSQEILVEYTAHPEARFHLPGGALIPVAQLAGGQAGPLVTVAPATERVTLRVLDKSGKPVAVKLHIHGEAGEYLPPVDRQRIPSTFWYEDWSVDYVNQRSHCCSYIPGETLVNLPLGRVFVEISKGFEIAPIRKVVPVTPSTSELTFVVDRVLPWRERGWVSADTHVHFLSPPTAHLEGAAEGVNVVNLLASQWGELMTNVGDFDGRTTYGSRESGGDGEYLVRVGTENRQHVLGHISLLGYRGTIIAPMCCGGVDESALGDPVDVLLTEWARQCHKQGGLVILPHFPEPRAEHAAAIISGDVDGVEMTSGANLYGGIDPYSLSDWYRYLNNGHFVAAVGGTDKMAATTAVGTVRTYARLPAGRPFDYDAWRDAIRSGNTFATYGPLMEFSVEGKPAGTRLEVGSTGGTLTVDWQVASVTVPMSRVALVVNGEIRESKQVDPREDRGSWSVKVDRSSWIALLVRGHYPDKPEIITAHSSPVMVNVKGSAFFSAADSLTILDQLEGALTFLDAIGTRANTAAYRRMQQVLLGAHRSLHNRLHERGVFHDHAAVTDHPEHHR